MLTFLLVVQAIIGAILVAVILMQQSEGGGLGMGGSPTGLMSARGAADFLTRATTILATIFIGLSILHAVLAVRQNGGGDIDTSLARKPPTAAPVAPTVPLASSPAAPVSVPVSPPATRSDSTRAEPTRAEPTRAEPIRAEPVRTPARTDPGPVAARRQLPPLRSAGAPVAAPNAAPAATSAPAPSVTAPAVPAGTPQ